MCAAVDEYLFDAGVCEKFKCVFNQRCVCEGEEALENLSDPCFFRRLRAYLLLAARESGDRSGFQMSRRGSEQVVSC